MLIRRIAKSKSKKDECKGKDKKPPKGKKLDTQLFPECKGTKYDRDIVKKEMKRKIGPKE